ncbi:MAG: O-antigen ligase family protein [Thermomicrobiales bacterium]
MRDDTTSVEDPAVSGRLSEMLAGLEMLIDHPFLGVGVGNYQEHYQDYARPLGIDRRTDRSAHSLPIEVLAETGLVGFGALVVMFGTVLVSLRGIWTRFSGNAQMRAAAKALFAAVCGFLAASIFLHDAFPTYMWMILAASFALMAVSDRQSAEEPGTS